MLNLKKIICQKLILTIPFVLALNSLSFAQCLSGNCVNGEGKFKAQSGDIYEGSFVNGRREGQGKYIWTNNAKYVGSFKDNKIEGYGIFTYADGDIFEGNFIDGKKDGKGTYKFISGNIFTGEYKNGQRNGAGKLYNKKQNTYQEGVWQDDKFITNSPRRETNSGEPLANFLDRRYPASKDDNKIIEKNVEPANLSVSNSSDQKKINPANEGKELFEAIAARNREKALSLIKSGINLNYQIPNDDCTLSVAIRNRDTEMAKILLESGAVPGLIQTGGGSPLQTAVQMSNFEIVELLINKYKVNVNTKDEGYTVLHTAASFNQDERILKLLLTAGANPNIYDDKGNSPLSIAQSNKDKIKADLLFQASNAEIKASPVKKKTEATLAIASPIIDSAPAGFRIRTKPSNSNELGAQLYKAVADKNDSDALRLIDQGAEVTYRFSDTPILNKAIQTKNYELVKALLEAGADPHLVDLQYGENALHLAVSHNQPELVRLLLKYKADPNRISKDGRTALHHAAIWTSDGEIAALLIAAGVNPNVITEDNRTAKEIALKENSYKIVAVIDKALSQRTYAPGIPPKPSVNTEATYAKRSPSTPDYRVTQAIIEYDKVHSAVETFLRQYLNAWEKYTKADPRMRSMMTGTRLTLVRTKESALSSVSRLLKDHGKYLPKSMYDHIQSDGGKFASVPF